MRIISGQFKGRKLHPPRKNPARPTTDIAKEGLFNILMNNIDFAETRFLDLFGGTGNISLEMASRGCPDVTNVELHGPNVDFLRKTAVEWGADIKVVQGDVFQFLQYPPQTYTLVFAGPPYPLPTLATLPEHVLRPEVMEPEGLFVLEHNPDHNFEDHPMIGRVQTYGTTHFSIFRYRP